MQTAHGEYPILPPRGDAIAEVLHFDRTIRFRTPPITIAAKLIYISRREMTPLQTPSDIPVDRPAALAQGINWGQTRADITEVNSHSSAQLVPTSDWNWKSTLTPEQRQGLAQWMASGKVDCWCVPICLSSFLVQPSTLDPRNARISIACN